MEALEGSFGPGLSAPPTWSHISEKLYKIWGLHAFDYIVTHSLRWGKTIGIHSHTGLMQNNLIPHLSCWETKWQKLRGATSLLLWSYSLEHHSQGGVLLKQCYNLTPTLPPVWAVWIKSKSKSAGWKIQVIQRFGVCCKSTVSSLNWPDSGKTKFLPYAFLRTDLWPCLELLFGAFL